MGLKLKLGDVQILLEPQIIKCLHGLNPRTILGQKWWDEKRQIAYASTGYHCAACRVSKYAALYHKWLEAHELYTINFDDYSYKLERIVPLCHSCHNFIHCGRLEALLDAGLCSPKKYNAIMSRGNYLLKMHNLDKEAHLLKLCGNDLDRWFPESDGSWKKWHLILDGKKYYSKFKDEVDWYNFYKEANQTSLEEQRA